MKRISAGLLVLSVIITSIGWVMTYNNFDSALATTRANLEVTRAELDVTATKLGTAVVTIESYEKDRAKAASSITELQNNLESKERELEWSEQSNESLRRSNTLLQKDSEAYQRMKSGFSSREELQEWLEDDQVSEHLYSSSYTCENFARDLSRNAKVDGYFLGLLEILVPRPPSLFSLPPLKIKGYSYPSWYDDYELHVRNFAIIGNEIFEVEPQTDEIKSLRYGAGW